MQYADVAPSNLLVLARAAIQGGPKKTGPFLIDDNFAMVNGRYACDVSKVCKFCLEKSVRLACRCI